MSIEVEPPPTTGTGDVIDAVIVTFRSADTIAAAVAPLVCNPSVHVIVVDNASDDGTAELLRTLPVDSVALQENTGFAHGCNVGTSTGRAPYVLLLNPDARIDAAALESLVAELDDDERAGAAAPQILEPDGSLDFSLRRFPKLRSSLSQALFLHRFFPRASWTDEVIRDRRAYEIPHAVEWASGACLLVRRSVLEGIGGLDESFFLYSEDVDLCARIRRAGYVVRYVPEAVATHLGGASAPRSELLPLLTASRMRYSKKHDRWVAAFLVRVTLALSAATHTLVARTSAQRKGHLRSLWVALRPLPGNAKSLIR